MGQENVNKIFKEWQILKHVFRHNVNKHCPVFWANVVLTQISFDMDAKLNYPVEYVGETYEEARQYLGNYINYFRKLYYCFD
jgi:LPS O-antigen subunit length determinant protein (WzzB/FepE family)